MLAYLHLYSTPCNLPTCNKEHVDQEGPYKDPDLELLVVSEDHLTWFYETKIKFKIMEINFIFISQICHLNLILNIFYDHTELPRSAQKERMKKMKEEM